MENDTIAAISTPMGEGGIGIIRVSGTDALHIVDSLYRGKQSLLAVDTHTIHYGHIVDPQNGVAVDEVMVTVLHEPRTYTKENIVEINGHGGIVSIRQILNLVLANGARLAEPGEFTKRAFLNGRLDLSQAEAVADVIRSKTDKAMQVAMQQVDGRLARLIKRLRQQLLETLAHVEVTIDYPEHDVESVTFQTLHDVCTEVKGEINQLLQTAEQGKILREGIRTAIIGRPNVGKSSLLNTLVQEHRAIVTDVPGTTRDVIEEYVNVRGVPLQLIDTAGIRETDDIVEKIGVERSRDALQSADLVLFVVNAAESFTEEDAQLLELARAHDTILLLNKIDLGQVVEEANIVDQYDIDHVIRMSVLEEEGIDQLEEAIQSMYFDGKLDQDDMTYVSNTRHIDLLRQAKSSIEEALLGLESSMPVDVVQIDIRNAWEQLGEITGDTVEEGLIDQLFSQFCLGK